MKKIASLIIFSVLIISLMTGCSVKTKYSINGEEVTEEEFVEHMKNPKKLFEDYLDKSLEKAETEEQKESIEELYDFVVNIEEENNSDEKLEEEVGIHYPNQEIILEE